MTGDDFLNLAIRLANSDVEADLRTSVSRCYYGAFHNGLEFLERCGIQLPRSADAHEKLQWCLGHSANETVKDAARKLDTLRAERNLADYNLRHGKFQRKRNALVALLAAQAIINALSLCGQEPAFASIRSAIRAYAKDILKLSVTEP